MAVNTTTKDLKGMVIIGIVVAALWLISLFAYPVYNVWRAEMKRAC